MFQRFSQISQPIKLLINLIIICCILLAAQVVSAQEWLPVRGGIAFGISGIALIKQENLNFDFLIVHDNKKSDQPRLAIIHLQETNQPQYLPINWPKNIENPIDLESLTLIPQLNNLKNNLEFIALASAGKAYHFQLNTQTKNISILKEFALPEISKDINIEAFSLQKLDNQIIAVWAHRGAGKESAKIYWGIFNPEKDEIQLINSANFQVPFPTGKVRHISDLKIDQIGIIYITTASDNGDDGPFESAVYIAGYLEVNKRQIQWRQNPQLFPIYRNKYHKIEGLELIPGKNGGIIVGTDDENMGSSVYMIGE